MLAHVSSLHFTRLPSVGYGLGRWCFGLGLAASLEWNRGKGLAITVVFIYTHGDTEPRTLFPLPWYSNQKTCGFGLHADVCEGIKKSLLMRSARFHLSTLLSFDHAPHDRDRYPSLSDM